MAHRSTASHHGSSGLNSTFLAFTGYNVLAAQADWRHADDGAHAAWRRCVGVLDMCSKAARSLAYLASLCPTALFVQTSERILLPVFSVDVLSHLPFDETCIFGSRAKGMLSCVTTRPVDHRTAEDSPEHAELHDSLCRHLAIPPSKPQQI